MTEPEHTPPPFVPYVPGPTTQQFEPQPPMGPPPAGQPPVSPAPWTTGAMPVQGFPPMAPPAPGRPPAPASVPGSGKGGGKPVIFGIIGLAVGLILGVCAGAAIAGGGKKENPALTAAAASPVLSTVYVTVTAAAPVTTTSPPTAPTTSPPPPPPPPAATIDDGTWTIGEDVPAGTYKVVGAPDSCYWAIYKSGQNQDFDAIINNHNGGGNLRVTLKAGQDFETARCGIWTKT